MSHLLDKEINKKVFLEYFLVILFFSLLIFLYFYWVLPSFFHSVIYLKTGDHFLHLWLYKWYAKTLFHNPFNLLNTNNFYPNKHTLLFSDIEFFNGFIAAILIKLFKWSDVLTYNFILFLSLVVSGVFHYILAKYLFRNPTTSLIVSLLFLLTPVRYNFFASPQLIFTGFISLFFLCLFRYNDTLKLRWLIYSNVILFCQYIQAGYYFIFLIFGYLIFLIIFLFKRPAAHHYLLSLILTFVLNYPVYKLYSKVMEEHNMERSIQEVANDSLNFTQYLSSYKKNFSDGELLYPRPLHLFPGFILILLSIAGLYLSFKTDKHYGILISSLLIFYIVVSFGTNGPYIFFYKYFEPLKRMRAVWRAYVLAVFLMSILSGIMLNKILELKYRRIIVTIILIVQFMIFPYIKINTQQIPLLTEKSKINYFLSNLSKNTGVIMLPLHSIYSGYYLYFSSFHWMGLYNGYSGFIPKDYENEYFCLLNFKENEWLDILKKKDIKYIVIHRTALTEERLNMIHNILKKEKIKLVMEEGNVELCGIEE
ncbi:MAG: hypothetical protein AB1765_05265 [Candidatus Hydrogenedentota bacterium]